MGEHKVLGIDHVGIAVADLDEAIAWYGEAFGLEATHTEVNEEQGVREAMLSAPDYFGEMGPLFGLPRSATARATEPTVVTGYSVKDFRDKLGIERLGDIVSVAKTRV